MNSLKAPDVTDYLRPIESEKGKIGIPCKQVLYLLSRNSIVNSTTCNNKIYESSGDRHQINCFQSLEVIQIQIYTNK